MNINIFLIFASQMCVNEDSLQIDVLVDMDNLWDIQGDETMRGEPCDPVAVNTKLGWVLSGPLKGKTLNRSDHCNVSLTLDMPKNVFRVSTGLQEQIPTDANVIKLWDLESLWIRRKDEVHEDLLDTISFTGERYSILIEYRQTILIVFAG